MTTVAGHARASPSVARTVAPAAPRVLGTVLNRVALRRYAPPSIPSPGEPLNRVVLRPDGPRSVPSPGEPLNREAVRQRPKTFAGGTRRTRSWPPGPRRRRPRRSSRPTSPRHRTSPAARSPATISAPSVVVLTADAVVVGATEVVEVGAASTGLGEGERRLGFDRRHPEVPRRGARQCQRALEQSAAGIRHRASRA